MKRHPLSPVGMGLMICGLVLLIAQGALPYMKHPLFFLPASMPVLTAPYFFRKLLLVDDAIYRLEHAARRDDFDPAEHGGNVPFWMRGNHRIYRQGVWAAFVSLLSLAGGLAILAFVCYLDRAIEY